MKIPTLILSTLSPFCLLNPICHAQIVDEPSGTSPALEANSEHLSADTLRAVFRGMTHVVQDTNKPQGEMVALFEVVENLAHTLDSPYGRPKLQKGDTFSISLGIDSYGQPNQVREDILTMKEGEQAVLILNTLFLFEGDGKQGGHIIRPCTRFALDKKAAPSTTSPSVNPALPRVQQALPTAPRQINPRPASQTRASSRSISVQIRNGEMQRTEHIIETDPVSGEQIERMIINGVEVDPRTRKPLVQPSISTSQPASTSPAAPAAGS